MVVWEERIPIVHVFVICPLEISEAFQDFKKPHPEVSLEDATHHLKERAIEGVESINNALPDVAEKGKFFNVTKTFSKL